MQSVHISIQGQTLANAGVYPCTGGGGDGVMLLNFAGGQYGFTIEGLSTSNAVLYQGSGNFTVNGNVTVNVGLTPPGGLTSATLSWTFPPNGASSTPDCTQAGVSEVTVAIDNGAPTQLGCALGLGASVRVDNLTPGLHSIVLEARDTNAYLYYRKSGSLTAQAGSVFFNGYAFNWAVGSLPLKWSFSNGITQLNCAQAGVTQVNINLLDSANNYLYGNTGVDVPCVLPNTGAEGTVFTYLNGGSYTLFLQAYGAGNVLFRSNFTPPPLVSVVDGQFPVIDGLTPTTLLTP